MELWWARPPWLRSAGPAPQAGKGLPLYIHHAGVMRAGRDKAGLPLCDMKQSAGFEGVHGDSALTPVLRAES
jgi:hypothetical protein